LDQGEKRKGKAEIGWKRGGKEEEEGEVFRGRAVTTCFYQKLAKLDDI